MDRLLDDLDLFTGPSLPERCRNEECERPFWPTESNAESPNRFCSKECEDEDREANE